MSTQETNKALFQRLLDEIWNQKNLAYIEQAVSPEIVNHFGPGMKGIAELTQVIQRYITAFPDIEVVIESVMAEGDQVSARFRYLGTHHGDLMGIPPTGKRIDIAAMEINRFQDSKIVETWAVVDQLNMMQQLGVVPAPQG